MNIISSSLQKDLLKCIPAETVDKFIRRLQKQCNKSVNKSMERKQKTMNEGNNPSSTASTFFRKTDAISKGRKLRLPQKSTSKYGNEKSNPDNDDKAKEEPQKKILPDRAVFYGDTELPYLHSSDALNSLYCKQEKEENKPLINPPPTISANKLVQVKSLYLYYTSIESLRQLGTGWSSLKSLTIMRSGLKDFGGASIFPSLEYMFVSYNQIQEISDIMYHGCLRSVDLENNLINSMDQMQYLYTIPLLEWVSVRGNPICEKKENYRVISENLLGKIEVEEHTKVEDYLFAQEELNNQIESFDHVQVSNYLLKCLHQQTKQDQIVLQNCWRRKEENQQLPDIVTYPVAEMENSQQSAENQEFILTPLLHFHRPQINTSHIQKYLHNKVHSNEPRNQSTKILNSHRLNQKMSATQGTSNTFIEERPKLSSSLKKHRLKFAPRQTFTTKLIQQPEKKQEDHDLSMGKFLRKRSMLKRRNLLGQTH